MAIINAQIKNGDNKLLKVVILNLSMISQMFKYKQTSI